MWIKKIATTVLAAIGISGAVNAQDQTNTQPASSSSTVKVEQVSETPTSEIEGVIKVSFNTQSMYKIVKRIIERSEFEQKRIVLNNIIENLKGEEKESYFYAAYVATGQLKLIPDRWTTHNVQFSSEAINYTLIKDPKVFASILLLAANASWKSRGTSGNYEELLDKLDEMQKQGKLQVAFVGELRKFADDITLYASSPKNITLFFKENSNFLVFFK